MAFSKLGLSPAVMDGVKAMGYVEPTPIQLRAIPLVLAGRDVIGSAQTGTGKTAAFALPILSKLGQHAPGPRALILEPTRELAAQVETAIHDYARFTNLKTTVVFGGVGYGRQNGRIARRNRHRRRHAGTFAGSFGTRHGAAGQGSIPRARRGRPDAGHGISARRAPHSRPHSRASATPRCFPRPFRRRSRRSSNGRCKIPRPSRSARAGRPPRP